MSHRTADVLAWMIIIFFISGVALFAMRQRGEVPLKVGRYKTMIILEIYEGRTDVESTKD
jgi:hypothetical protein